LASSQIEVICERLNGSGEGFQFARFPTLILALALAVAHPLARLRWVDEKNDSSINVSCLSCHNSHRGNSIAGVADKLWEQNCGRRKENRSKKRGRFLDKDAKPDERKYLLAAKPFFIAVANRKYADAYALLSSHARAQMSFNQFTPAAEQATFQQYESNPYMNVTAEQFAYLMQYVEAALGAPRAPKMLSVFLTDPDVLNRRSKEQFGAMDSMFAIGAMPEWIPADIRRASLRGQIHTELSPQELEKVAQEQGISVEELKKEEDFDPYFNLKVVLVEEGGQLMVGYFEFLPPSMLD
jgi:hypothetical protein